MKLDVKIPFDNIAKVECYVPGYRTYAHKVQETTGADLVINSAIFNMSTGIILSRVCSYGKTYGTSSAPAWGLGFGADGSVVKTWDNGINCSHYLGPYSYAVIDNKISDGLKDTAKRGRMLVGITDDSLIVLGFDDGDSSKCSTTTACQGMLGRGCKFAINLDGGGSVQWAGKYGTCKSSRSIPAFLCIWLKDKQIQTNEGEKKPVRAIATKKMNVYNSMDVKESGRYIAVGDVCEIGEITTNLLIPVTYPISTGTRQAYVKSLENFIQG